MIIDFNDQPAALKNRAIDAAALPEPTAADVRKVGLAVPSFPNPAPNVWVTWIFCGKKTLVRRAELTGTSDPLYNTI